MINMNFEHSSFTGLYFEHDVDIQKTSFARCRFINSNFGSPRITNTDFGNSHFSGVIFVDDSKISVSTLELDDFEIIAVSNKQGKLSEEWSLSPITLDAEDMETDDDLGNPYGIPTTELSTIANRNLPFISRSYGIDGAIFQYPTGIDMMQYPRPTRQALKFKSKGYDEMPQEFNDLPLNAIKFSRKMPKYINTKVEFNDRLYDVDIDVADDATAFLPSGESVPLFSYLKENPDYVAFTLKNQSEKNTEYSFSLISKRVIDNLNAIQSKMNFVYDVIKYDFDKTNLFTTITGEQDVLIYPYMRADEKRSRVHKARLDLDDNMIKKIKESGIGHITANDPYVIYDILSGLQSLRVISLNGLNKFVYPYFKRKDCSPKDRLFAIGLDDEVFLDVFRFKNGYAEYSKSDNSSELDHYKKCRLFSIRIPVKNTPPRPAQPTLPSLTDRQVYRTESQQERIVREADIVPNQIAYDTNGKIVQLFTYMKENPDTVVFIYKN